MWWTTLKKWFGRNRWAVIISAVLLVLAVGAAYDSCQRRAELAEAKKAEQEQAAKAKAIEEREAASKATFDKVDGARKAEAEAVLTEIRAVKANVVRVNANLARVEAARAEIWQIPAVDNGDLAARFDKALEALK